MGCIQRKTRVFGRWFFWFLLSLSSFSIQSSSFAFHFFPPPNPNKPSSSSLAKTKKDLDVNNHNHRRRELLTCLTTSGIVLLTAPSSALAGEVGAKITKAVTTSDLGISVRTSVVKGAQIMDKVDGQWERFSDKYGLGAERSKQGKRPTPKVIPELLPLDVASAKQLLEISDTTFISLTGISKTVLQEKIEKVAGLTRLSFERAGVVFQQQTENNNNNNNNLLDFTNASQLNFVAYAHFKAYSDLFMMLQERNPPIPFNSFRSTFEQKVGTQVVAMFLPEYKNGSSHQKETLKQALLAVDTLCTCFRNQGLVASYEISTSLDNDDDNDDKISDWIDYGDLEFTVALDGDATLNAQILLQEQGFRLYPNFARYAIKEIMSFEPQDKQSVTVTDYYFDTDYNSDPDKFDVKQVLLSVQMEQPL